MIGAVARDLLSATDRAYQEWLATGDAVDHDHGRCMVAAFLPLTQGWMAFWLCMILHLHLVDRFVRLMVMENHVQRMYSSIS